VIPDKATYGPDESVVIEFDEPAPGGELQVLHLDVCIARKTIEPGALSVDLGPFEIGGYGVTFGGDSTAIDVLASRWDRPRYGFVVRLAGDVDEIAVTRLFRRLHLNAAQLYDWAYRHSALMPPARHYVDPLGQPRDMDLVNTMCAALKAAGVTPLGYSAVYAVGHEETDAWADALLLKSDGSPYRLGDDFLVLLDPAYERWLDHYLDELERVIVESEISGFHLDQYGWPKFARRGDGERIDLAASFGSLIGAVRTRLPDVPFMFNNVNDFPTQATAPLEQDATYIEVWEPHTTLGDLGALAASAWMARKDHPPILSAYLSCYVTGTERGATEAATLVMATAFSHGASHLLLGEAGSALVDPYYPTNHVLSNDSVDVFAQWYDFAVRYGDLLYGADRTDVTEFFAGGINEDVVLDAGGAAVSTKAQPGSLWLRVVRVPRGIVVHVINLAAQTEVAWDAVKQPTRRVDAATLSLSFVAPGARVLAASPQAPTLESLAELGELEGRQDSSLSAGQSGVRFALPDLGAWTVVWIPAEELAAAPR
jgi:dextranase